MILVTGGAGYIGSHAVIELLQNNYEVIVLDNLVSSSVESIARIETITNRRCRFIEGDIRDLLTLDIIFRTYDITAVMHFAGLTCIEDSLRRPFDYYDVNVRGTLVLGQAMATAGITRLIFSSSASVYGIPAAVPIAENSPTGTTTNPYATSKYLVERMLSEFCAADSAWSVMALRYFNPIGAHSSGDIGESSSGTATTLLSRINQVASGHTDRLRIFGDDYATVDGTGVRDYIHVEDLVKGHLAALVKLSTASGYHVYNLGTGRGYSVLEVVKVFEDVSGINIPYEICARRPGDVGLCFSDPGRAEKELGWRAHHPLRRMIADAWQWQTKNPKGF